MFTGAWLSHHALTSPVSPSQLLTAAGARRVMVSFTSTLATVLRAPPPPSMGGTRPREPLASAAEPGTCRKMGFRTEMAEVGLPVVRTCSSFRAGIRSFQNHTGMPSAQPFLGWLGASQVTCSCTKTGGEGVSAVGCLPLETS